VTPKNDALTNREAVLIVAKPGRLRDSLKALLKPISRIQIVGQAADGPAALSLVKQHCPKLILLDGSLPDNQNGTLLRLIKAQYPQAHCIVLAENIQQQRTARMVGANTALLKGFAVAELFTAIEKILFALNYHHEDGKLI
jgi:DNA-binding NarL/FixJ family response regulator